MNTQINLTNKPRVVPKSSTTDNQLGESRWYAIKTRAKCEKNVANALSMKQIKHYLPLVRTIKRYTRKVRKVEKPLINSYVFVKIDKTEYVRVLETEHVIQFIRFSNQLAAIPEDEINIIRRLVMEHDIELETISGSITTGDPVVITAGSLMGHTGKVIKVEGKRKLVIELGTLGHSLLITVDAQLIQKWGL
jgi:transcription antitermination factor NusG